MTSTPNSESTERVIAAPASEVFELLANPYRHHEFDGSGTVRDAVEGPQHATLGDTFSMGMQIGAKYSMINEIVEYEKDRRIAWQARPTRRLAQKAIGGRIWRYELEPVGDGTRVTETWDISEEKFPALVRPMRKLTASNMAKSLERIEQLVA